MANRELVVLGTASQVPTRHRNHNAYLLRWDGHGILFDPGEGAQRQFTFAGVSPATTSRICITHFHGDHCLGLPGMVMRLALDQGHWPVPIHYPASGQEYFDRLITATAGQESLEVDARPIADDGAIHTDAAFTLSAARLRHRVDSVGYRLHEPDGRRMLPDLLADAGVEGPDIGRLQSEGSLEVDGRTVTLESVSAHRIGQTFAFVMDTAWCQAAVDLAADADLLVCEATFLSSDEEAASEYGHLTARQAGRLAREAGVGTLVLSHFSARYAEVEPFADEARAVFDGEVVLATDFLRVPVPRRH